MSKLVYLNVSGPTKVGSIDSEASNYYLVDWAAEGAQLKDPLTDIRLEVMANETLTGDLQADIDAGILTLLTDDDGILLNVMPATLDVYIDVATDGLAQIGVDSSSTEADPIPAKNGVRVEPGCVIDSVEAMESPNVYRIILGRYS